ncbi:MAG TPA: enoyl-CoA hydratase/isomerase family protein [Beijerinckiaceae bacterium]|jgi:enoyl-CoA hydratase|nr:enoyl-CoA hydratase/isomerase family protein [Microvirga sp.]HZB36869.1 enoyl-CoA hydratase/isomerase family protein [Beijerinckiaceae bacterium]
MAGDAEVLCERRGAAGLVTLNRPQALNAITHGMVLELRRALDAWAADPEVTRIVVTAAGERAFSAGGDIRHLYDLGTAGRYEEALRFWRDEYALNIRIKRYPKPYISLIDGIVMGGGVGVSLHGSHRVAGERYQFAMPEVGIGFFPDVGATHALPRLPGKTGAFIALTGERVRTADALAFGLATHAVRSPVLAELREALTAGEPVEETLARLSHDPGPTPLAAERETIDRCFAGESVTAILASLDSDASDFGRKTAATIRAKSPTSLVVALEQMRRGRDLSFENAMRTEFRIVSRIIEGHDFYEGVRAAIIDKDGAPRWRPASLEEVDAPAAIAHHFAELGRAELELP